MAHFPGHLIAGVVLVVAALALQAVTANQLIKRKLRLTVLLASAYILLNLFLARAGVAPEVQSRLESIEQLLLALAVINLLVVAGLNPLREDRVPDRFPNIVQDALIVGLFVIVATVVMQEKFLTTSAVGAVVVGFALQDTLGNAFAGLAIQVEKPFHVGHWITVGSFEGRVAEITWRATKLRTKAGNFVILPNNILSKEAITNYSAPAVPTRITIEIGAAYDHPPNDVKQVILEAVDGASYVLKTPAPDVILADFGASALVYHVRFWIGDYAHDDLARDQVRAAIYYAFRRHEIEIPYPIQVEYHRTAGAAAGVERLGDPAAVLATVDVLAPLSDADRQALVETSRLRLFGAGEAIVRQDQAGSSMFVVCAGRARVTIEPGGVEVATVDAGGYFGEMSLLTGESRTATVTALGDCWVLEITADAVRRVALRNQDVVDRIGLAVMKRREEMAHSRATAAALAGPPETSATFLARIRRFLKM